MKYIRIKCYKNNKKDCDCVINIKRIDCISHCIDDDGKDKIKIFVGGSDCPIIAYDYNLETILYLIENA